MKKFTNQEIEDYYNHTEVHYRWLWKLEKGMGLHYGVWDTHTKTLTDAIINTNDKLMLLGDIQQTDMVLDAGCGIGGSCIYLARNKGCKVQGITLSKRQVNTATRLANNAGLSHLVAFSQQDYTDTQFDANTFDVVWCIESMQTAADKDKFFKEAARILKPGGRLLIGDIFKPHTYDIDTAPDLQTMINGWAMSDILSTDELNSIAARHNMEVTRQEDVTRQVKKSVNRMYFAGLLGMIGTRAYILFHKATYFSGIHYKTGLAQMKAYEKKQWGYYLVVIEKAK